MVKLNFESKNLSHSQKKVADFIYKQLESLPFLTEQDIARQSGVSISTVSRFWNVIGYNNLKHFKQQLKSEKETTPVVKMKDKMEKVADHDLFSEMIQLEMRNLAETMNSLARSDFNDTVNQIIQADQIFLYGSGPSHSLCELLQFRLNRLGYRIHHISKGGWELFESVGNIGQSDLLIVFGFANSTPESKLLLDLAKEAQCPSVLITDMLVSNLRDAADLVLYTCRGKMFEFHSLVAPVALIDSLTVAIVKKDEKNALHQLQNMYELRKKYSSFIQYK
ncbi:MurR/RpiR family transcriptional regulator [Bacillus sp. 03113]|uniref:MurR/RpiR family transcriptional regulator n=1 Tax=Bacillus sp. 03113 TaxID=2578211 RepID=UPI001141D854|nr:MurR/RpiR family transcriptional regulator [Bacillus sp. 03113]